MQLVFFGSGAFGLATLERLVRDHRVRLVVSQPDRPAGRSRRPTPTPIATFATAAGLPVVRPERADDPAAVEAVRAVPADAFVVIAYGHKLTAELLADRFAINLHASLLPKYRGAAPINWAMINGETETGVSVITLAQRMDAGAVLAQRRLPIDPMETAGELHDRLAQLGPEVIEAVLAAHAAGRLEPVSQDETLATAAPKLRKHDGTVRFDQPAAAVQCRIHGLTPWPGCTVRVGDRRLKLLRVERVATSPPDSPGTIGPEGMVTCGQAAIRPLEVQPPGGRPMTFEDYLRGYPISPGVRMEPV